MMSEYVTNGVENLQKVLLLGVWEGRSSQRRLKECGGVLEERRTPNCCRIDRLADVVCGPNQDILDGPLKHRPKEDNVTSPKDLREMVRDLSFKFGEVMLFVVGMKITAKTGVFLAKARDLKVASEF